MSYRSADGLAQSIIGTGRITTTLSAQTGVATGSVIDLGQANNVSFVASGTSTDVSLTFQGSLDNTNWFTLITAVVNQNISANMLFSSVDKPVRYVRASTTAIANGNVTVTVAGA